MSNEMLAQVAFCAMNGNGSDAQDAFEAYCEESDIALGEYDVDLERVAKLVISYMSGNNKDGLVLIAKEFGFEAVLPKREIPNETDAIENVVDELVANEESSTEN